MHDLIFYLCIFHRMLLKKLVNENIIDAHKIRNDYGAILEKLTTACIAP